ncbi:MAG TPA: DNA repair protein RecN [Candidatus Limnocylindrales bacterium]|nr:DNA repair protein RecN [Candidatus Limnocylindrales bacterium]
MLIELRIRNLAVIEDVRVPFGPGLNVLTGETGAGKSIVIDALLMIIGVRAQPDLIRSHADSASVEATFELSDESPAAAVLEAAGHGLAEGQLVIRRELARTGRHRVFVNDAPATVSLLERLGEALVELHGQHEHQRLMEPARQLGLLDRFAGSEAGLREVSDRVRGWETARGELARMASEARAEARQEVLYRFQLSEIDAVGLKDGEEDELRAERQRLQHAERIAAGLREAMALLYDERDAVAARLARVAAVLGDVAAVDPAAAAPGEHLEAAAAHVEEAVSQLRTLRDRVASDPERVEEIDARLDGIVKLKRKYGESAAAIWQYRQEIAERLDRLTRHDELVAEIDRRVATLSTEADTAGRALSSGRAEAAARLERLIQKELRGLGMEHARFRVALRREKAGPGELGCGPEGWRLGPRGAESAEFLFSANPGEELRPLARVASGGELSRTMLAVKTVLAASDDVPTMVFDEVDAGIGGRIADVIAEKLRETAAGRQVLCVTHLAQIAARAAHHLAVDKHTARGATRTSLRALDAPQRVEELARMLAGDRITDVTRRHARELYEAAHPRR